MDHALFRAFSDIAFAQAGIRLGEGKQAHVSARVAKRLRALGLKSERAYLDKLQKDESGEELVRFLDVISTNYTTFFREPDHFDLFGELIDERLKQGIHRMRFWSAASSSGEEPYSMAIAATEACAGTLVDFKILATDISTHVLGKAHLGEYTAAQIEPVPKGLRARSFEKAGQRGAEPLFKVKRELRERVVFTRLNLAQPPFPMKGPLEAVFCRNVMIYLGAEVRQRLIAEIERLLRPGGLLFIGHAETLTQVRSGLKVVKPSVYRKPL
jgi:chemotaxis protein methyltransferase CheR